MKQVQHSQRVAVIGAGIVGVCCAAYLQRSGFTVDVFDPDGIGHGCSKGNAGHLATEQVFPMASMTLLPQLPRLLASPASPLRLSPLTNPPLLPWLYRFGGYMRRQVHNANSLALQQLNAHARTALSVLLGEAHCSSLVKHRGSWWVSERATLKQATTLAQRYTEAGIAAVPVSGDDIRRDEPALANAVRAGILFPDTGHVIDPHLLTLKLFAHCQANGARLIPRRVTQLIPRPDHVLLDTGGTPHRYEQVVLAAGTASKSLLCGLGIHIPLIGEYGFHTMMDSISGIERPVTSAERHCILTPMANGLRVAGYADFCADKAAPQKRRKRAQVLFHHARALVTADKALCLRGDSHWCGARPSLPDSLPIIDTLSGHPRILLATGHGHLGLTQAGITGQLISQLASGQAPAIDLAPFAASRFHRGVHREPTEQWASKLPHY